MIDFDDPNALIGDSGDIVQCNPQYSLVHSFHVILGIVPADRDQWNRAWLLFYNLELPEYIQIIADLPDLVLKKRPLTDEGKWVLEQIKQLYKALAAWLEWITKPDRPKPVELEQPLLAKYESFAWLSNAILDLCTAINSFNPRPEFLYPLFNSPAHLWFWCEVAFCQYRLKVLEKKPHTDVQGKKEVLTDWSDQLKSLEDRKQVFKGKRTRSKNLISFLERLYPDVIQWEALEIAEVDSDFEYGAWADFVKVQHYVRNEAKNGKYAKNQQALFLYFFPDSPAITKLHVTGQHHKLPKPKGFKAEEPRKPNVKKCK